MSLRYVLTVWLLGSVFVLWSQPNLREVYNAGTQAYDSGNYEAFLDKMIEANAIRDNHPTLIYNLAAAYALNDRKREAIASLNRVIWMNANLPFQEDEDFTSIRNLSSYQNLVEEAKTLNTKLETGSVAFTLEDPGLHPEGVAYSKASKKFYVGSVRQRKIVSIDADGKQQDFASGPELYAIMGLKVDDKRGLLWTCSTPIPEMLGYEEGKRAEIRCFDVNSGALVGTYVAPEEDAWLGDLEISRAGKVYVSNSSAQTASIYEVDEMLDTLLVTYQAKALVSLQGIALDDPENALFIADYRDGLFKLDLRSKELIAIENSTKHPLKGIDGLYYNQRALIGIHNGLSPFRIVKYELNADQNRIASFTILEKSLPEMDEPTLGVFVDNHLFYISNSPWGKYDKDKVLNLDEVQLPIIRKVQLKGFEK